MARFLLAPDLGNGALRDIGDHLRRNRAAFHWIERYRGRSYVHSRDPVSIALLRSQFAEILEEVDEYLPDSKN